MLDVQVNKIGEFAHNNWELYMLCSGLFLAQMALANFEMISGTECQKVSAESIQMHPGAHVLHYSSNCGFEGFKALRSRMNRLARYYTISIWSKPQSF